MKLIVSKHCKERYKERISGEYTDIITILKQISNGIDITNKIYDEVPRYILYLYEKYGELGQKIILSNNIIFILKKNENSPDLFHVITCYKNENHLEQFKNSSLSRSEIFYKISIIKKKLRK